MAKEIKADGLTTGQTNYYARIESVALGQIWNNTSHALESANASNIALYVYPLTELMAGTGEYDADFPALLPAGTYSIGIYQGTGAAADPLVAGPSEADCKGPGAGQASLVSDVLPSLAALPASDATAILGHVMPNGRTFLQNMVELMAVSVDEGGTAPVWNASTHTLDVAYTLGGVVALTHHVVYPNTQTTAPPVQSVTTTIGTIPAS